MGRILLFASAVLNVLLLTLIYAILNGQYAALQPAASPTPAVGSTTPGSTAAQPSASAGAAPSSPGTVLPSASGSASAVRVAISNLQFGPNLTVSAGTTVTFVNNDTVKHTATHGTNGRPAAGSLFDLQLDVGVSGSYTFTPAGTYQVTCTVHPTMNITITVQ